MPHDITLISTITIGFALAFLLGFLANRLGASPLVGYLAAGIAVGPFTPGFVADGPLAGQLAEIGVMLLMFGVGLHFSVADLMTVRRIVILGAVGQIVIATGLGLGLAQAWGWGVGAGVVLGLSLSVASTVVLLKALEERNAVTTVNGRIAIGWLIVEDLAMVLALVLLPAFATALGGQAGTEAHAAASHGWAVTLGITLAKVAAFVALALLVGPRVLPWLLHQVARTGSRELFTLCVLTVALGIAFGSAKLFSVSFALGAFFAGMVLNESELSHKAAANSLPLQDAFAVLFFVSVGMLFDPGIMWREPLMVLNVLLLILIGKSLVAMGIVLAMGYPLSTALFTSASLAQIGEFSFILAGLGITYGLLPQEGLNLILAGALLSITLHPLAFRCADGLLGYIRAWPWLGQRFEEQRGARITALQADLETARLQAEQKAASHKTFTPQELAERFPLFAGLTTEQREVLLLHFQPRTAEPGERIFRAGDAADAVFFISQGEVEVTLVDRHITLEAGDVFGEMALINGQPRSADVTALDYSKFAVLSRRDFRQLLRRYPEIRAQISDLAAQREEIDRQWLDEYQERERAQE
ncbi:MAG: cyclic nucleotide-binding domain-containing protein [Candidatus Tectomicrobia bacterium]|uniref:Cyclic nucleotide-binding domain-containing protein n=1 Tax=Tectimicrobiota bacterium TaxID=2528274 RepID=A0A937W1M1_UNCTE|nr:cyclic nucleotide-binding domain-containing protein [Candidatus Tectomicrobia bacterium]